MPLSARACLRSSALTAAREARGLDPVLVDLGGFAGVRLGGRNGRLRLGLRGARCRDGWRSRRRGRAAGLLEATVAPAAEAVAAPEAWSRRRSPLRGLSSSLAAGGRGGGSRGGSWACLRRR